MHLGHRSFHIGEDPPRHHASTYEVFPPQAHSHLTHATRTPQPHVYSISSTFLIVMSSWLSLGRRTPEGGADESKEASLPSPPTMDPEEVRRRRIERLEAAVAAQAEAARQQQEQDAAEMEVKEGPTPTISSSSSTPSSAGVAPSIPMDISTPSSSQQETNPAASSSTTSSCAKIKASELAMHRLIQRVLYVTADANDTNGGSYVEVPNPTAVEEGSTSIPLFTLDAVSELICARLSLNPGGGVGGDLIASTRTGLLYMAGCYARQEEEARLRRPGVTVEALKELREQVINFGVSSIIEPDVFGLSPAEITGQLSRGLVAMAESPAACTLPLGFLKGLLEGMEEGDIPRIFAPVLSDLLGGLIRAQKLSDPGAVVNTHAIVLLLKQHKALAEALVVGVANFILPPGGYPVQTMMGRVKMQRNGRVHENYTTLGVLFRLGFPETDPEVLAKFDQSERRSQQEVDGKMKTLQQQLKVGVSLRFHFCFPSLPPSFPAGPGSTCPQGFRQGEVLYAQTPYLLFDAMKPFSPYP